MVPPKPRKATLARDLKYLDVAYSSTGVNTSGTAQSLCQIAGGTGFNNRLGPKIKITNIEVDLLFLASLMTSITTADIYNNIRMILSRATGRTQDLSVSLFPSVYGGIDIRSRFEVLRDDKVFLNNYASGLAAAASAYGATPSAKWVRFTFPYNSEVVFDDTSTTTDSVNGPYLYFVSDSAAAPNPTVQGNIRVWFHDMVDK